VRDKKAIDCTLYLVTDRDLFPGIRLAAAVGQAIRGGVTMVQLREKNACSRDFYHIALEVKEITDRYSVPLIINDRLDIALAVDAAGVHTGQDDLPARVAREVLSGRGKILGVSAATVAEALQAQADGADYIGAGSVFATGTKKDVRPLLREELKKIKQAVNIPVVAIGGINESNVRLLQGTGIDGIAVVSAILGRDDAQKAARDLRGRLEFIQTGGK
jgi:thiamine-phosphate pyrophosphorylase